MDFSPVALSDDDQAFLEQTRAFIAEHVTDEVRRRGLRVTSAAMRANPHTCL